MTPIKEIVENDYILSANTYNPHTGEEEKEHRNPKEILREVEVQERKVAEILREIREQL